MRQTFRIDLALLVICLSFSFVSMLQAQQANRSGQRPGPAAGDAKMPIQKAPPQNGNAPTQQAVAGREKPSVPAPTQLSPELEKILKRWEEESAKIKTLHGTQSRSEFNHTFEVEKVTSGPFYLETPDKGRIDMMAIPIKKGAVSKKKSKQTEGKFYALETDNSQKWICTGDAILQLNEKEETYQKMEIPEDQRGANIVNSPLPFLFGIKADEAKRRFNLSLFKEDDDIAILVVFPRLEKDRQNYTKAAITLEKKRYLPTQVRMIDESGLEIVYTFESVKINEPKNRLTAIFSEKDPYHPNLKGLKLVIPNGPEVPAIVPVKGTGGKDSRKLIVEPAPSNPPGRAKSTANGPGPGTLKK